jgi:putative peptidoglycan lipid II flippase
MALLRSITTVGGYTMISRVLGFARDILIADILGASAVADTFFVAFKYPNFFRRLFAEGAFNAAFVPLFSGLLAAAGRARAKAFAEGTFAVLLCALLFLVAAFEIAMPWAMYAIAPGFAADPEKFQLAVTLTRITFPYLLFISLVSLMAGVLNSLDRFAAAAATPIILNISLIAALIGLARFTDTPGHALAWGVAAAGIAQFLWLYVVLHGAGMGLKLRLPRLTPKVRRLLKLMLPGAIGAGVVQINLLIDVLIASFLPSGAISYLYFADRVNQLPVGVIGVGVGTALLPLLSRQIRSEQAAAALDSQNRALEFALLLTIPAAAALMVISGPVIGALFGRGAFGAVEVGAASMALVAYGSGLPAYVLVKVLTPGYFARENTVTPVKIASLCVAINLVLNLALMGPLAHVGIALATAIAAWINAALLAVGLMKRGHLVIDDRLKSRLPRIALAAGIMTVCLVLGGLALAGPLGGAEGGRIGALVALVAGGIAVFGATAHFSGAADLKELKTIMGRT